MFTYSNIDYKNIKMSYAVAAINDYNNNIIQSSDIFIHINNCKPYVKKEDGFFIFIEKYPDELKSNDTLVSQLKSNDTGVSQLKSNDTGVSQLRIFAEGLIYQPKSICLNTGNDDCYGKIIYIRLLPNKMYPAYDNATVIKGKGEPGQVLYLLFGCKKNPYIISTEYKFERSTLSNSLIGMPPEAARGVKHDNSIKIFHEKNNKLAAMTFFADLGESDCIFSIENTLPNEQGTSEYNQSYRINNEYRLNKEYDPNIEYNPDSIKIQADTYLKRLYMVKADKKGEFYFLVPNEAQDDCEFEYSMKGEKGSFIKMELSKNKINVI